MPVQVYQGTQKVPASIVSDGEKLEMTFMSFNRRWVNKMWYSHPIYHKKGKQNELIGSMGKDTHVYLNNVNLSIKYGEGKL